jgi:iron-sulfur cluster assembly accessory protein
MMTITDKAAEKIRCILANEKKDPGFWGLRVGIEGGGCSGYQYKLDLTERQPDDNVYERGEAKVFIDPRSLLFLGGSTVDYVESLTGAGFTIRNPNVSGTCGCGTSFSV